MAAGAPLGVLLNDKFGISGFAVLIIIIAVIGLLFARTRADVSVSAGVRAPFHVVARKIWPYGLGLGLGTVGFGVIATFITLYFASHSWQGAAFTLSLFSIGFICIRLVLGNTITRFGGLRVSLVCFVVECLGLLIIWFAPNAWMAGVGAFLTGSGFSLVFPALGVEAVKQVEEQNQGHGTGNLFRVPGFGVRHHRSGSGLDCRILSVGQYLFDCRNRSGISLYPHPARSFSTAKTAYLAELTWCGVVKNHPVTPTQQISYITLHSDTNDSRKAEYPAGIVLSTAPQWG
ncbi:major facilitator superfamily transporter [Kluyvera intermedia]|nr:major facilitator superfamily transporter [Kluyvera intermedia]